MFLTCFTVAFLNCLCSTILAADPSVFERAKQSYDRSSHTELDREEYVKELTILLGEEIAIYLDNRKNDQVRNFIESIDAELKLHPYPETADGKQLSELRTGKWKATRHTNIYRQDGTWQMLPEDDAKLGDDAPHGHWRIEGNKYIVDNNTYIIIYLNDENIVFTKDGDVFYERLLSK